MLSFSSSGGVQRWNCLEAGSTVYLHLPWGTTFYPLDLWGSGIGPAHAKSFVWLWICIRPQSGKAFGIFCLSFFWSTHLVGCCACTCLYWEHVISLIATFICTIKKTAHDSWLASQVILVTHMRALPIHYVYSISSQWQGMCRLKIMWMPYQLKRNPGIKVLITGMQNHRRRDST